MTYSSNDEIHEQRNPLALEPKTQEQDLGRATPRPERQCARFTPAPQGASQGPGAVFLEKDEP